MANKFDYSSFRNYKFQDAIRPLGHFICKVILHTSYKGQENIPADKSPVIFCPNHISAKDPIVVAMGTKKRVHFMAKEELFKNPIVALLLKHNNSFPVSRGKMDVDAVKYSVELVNHGRDFGIFPEGTRSKDGKPKNGKNGAAYIAKKTGADIIPVAICKHNDGKKITVVYGKPIKNSELGFTESKSKSELNAATERIMNEITSLWEEELCK
ncbi:MAG: 1-acyl-sn-glycerol-3-phosphate acyltransferase [Clostridia bacterium]|nr:1-acyl-sn-glycerol-3-phosphate acyltransferase [Clostridia bacterium]